MREMSESNIRSRNCGKYLQSHLTEYECHLTQVKIVKCTHVNLLDMFHLCMRLCTAHWACMHSSMVDATVRAWMLSVLHIRQPLLSQKSLVLWHTGFSCSWALSLCDPTSRSPNLILTFKFNLYHIITHIIQDISHTKNLKLKLRL
jgi:hypothetical protein